MLCSPPYGTLPCPISTGRRCKDRGDACFECCTDTDCPSVGLGERCEEGSFCGCGTGVKAAELSASWPTWAIPSALGMEGWAPAVCCWHPTLVPGLPRWLQVCVRSVQHEGLHRLLLLGRRRHQKLVQAGWQGLRGAWVWAWMGTVGGWLGW